MESLSKETLELIQKTAVDAAGAKGKVELLRPPGEPEHVYLAVNSGGTITRYDAIAKPRSHTLVTLEHVLRFVELKGDEIKTVVWFDRTGVVIVIDDATRRDWALMRLSFTPQMTTLLALEKNHPEFDQRGFRRLLKVDLAGCRRDDVLLNWVEEVRFNSTSYTAGGVKHQKESLGRDIEQEAINDLGECPDEVLLNVRVFDDPSLRSTWPVRCDVEIVISDERFKLNPLPLELHNAIESELSGIGDILAKHVKCPVFRGRP